MSGRSSIDSLRRLSPVSDAEAAIVFSAGREELLAGLTGLPFGRPARARQTSRTRPRRALVLAFAVVAVLGMTAAAWAFFRSSAQETTSVQCLIDGNDTIIPSISGSPAQDCAVTWKRDNGTSAPPLAAYDNGHGGVTVIPRSEAPQAGWKRLESGSQDVDLIQLQTSLDDYVAGLNSSCLDGAAATKLADAKLAQFGLTGWTVSVRSADSAGGTCVSADVVDPASQSVALIPAGVSNGPETTYEKLAAKLRPLAQNCQSLPAAVAAVRSAAGELGLSESTRTYDLNAVRDDSLHCASIYETVGGTIFVTVRGPSG